MIAGLKRRFTVARAAAAALAIGAATALGGGSAMARVYSFVALPIIPPSEVDRVLDVFGPNRDGAFVVVGAVGTSEVSYLWKDEVWTRVPIENSPSVQAAGVSDELLVFGTYRSGGGQTDGFTWDARRGASPRTLGFRPTSASSQGDIVGNRAGVGAVATLPGLGDIILDPLPGGSNTVASAINDRIDDFGGPGLGVPPYIVGRARDRNGVDHAVIWIDGDEIYSLDAGEFYPTAVDDESHVSGYLSSGSRIQPCVWIRQAGGGTPTWIRFDLPGETDVAAADINSLGEMVGGKSLWVVDTQIVHVPLTEATYFPRYVPLDNGNFTSITVSDYELFGIGDSGEMLGIARLADNATLPVKIVPYDRNNNAVPDYREVDLASAVLDLTAGFIPPELLQARIGLHAPSRWLARFSSQYDPANTINEVHVVRFLTNHNRTHLLLNDPKSCEEFSSLIATWTEYERQNGQTGAEIVYTERSNFRAEWHPKKSKDLDYIPPRDRPVHGEDELTQRMVLQNSKAFAKRYARYVDFFQFGNESFTAAGVYYFEDLEYIENGERKTFTGNMGRVPGAALPAADAEIRTWWQKRMDALLIGSALVGRPLQFIGSALPTQAIFAGLTGNSFDFENMEPGGSEQAGANRSAFAVRAAIEFCNQFGALTDLHMHFYNYQNHLVRIVDALEVAPGETGWPRPAQVACLEYGPSASRRWWYRAGGGRETAKFYDNNPLTLPDGIATWDEWVDKWLRTDADLRLHDTFLGDGMDYMKAHGYALICYSDTLQTSADPDDSAPYDMSAIFPSKLDPEFEPVRATRWKRAFEEAASTRALENFTPRPYKVPDFCAPLP